MPNNEGPAWMCFLAPRIVGQRPVPRATQLMSRLPSRLPTVSLPRSLLLQYPSVLDSVRWSSGLPRMLLASKDGKNGLAAGAQLRLFRADVSGLKAALQAMPDEDWAGVGRSCCRVCQSLWLLPAALPPARPPARLRGCLAEPPPSCYCRRGGAAQEQRLGGRALQEPEPVQAGGALHHAHLQRSGWLRGLPLPLVRPLQAVGGALAGEGEGGFAATFCSIGRGEEGRQAGLCLHACGCQLTRRSPPALPGPGMQLLGTEDVSKIMRLQFAVMGPNSQIKRHKDMGGYAQLGHRIHIVVQSNPSESVEVLIGGC